MNNTDLIEATVARGRTIMHGAATVIGKGADGKDIHDPKVTHFGPGDKVRLPRDEVMRLRESGYLVDPDAPVIPRGEAKPGDAGFVGEVPGWGLKDAAIGSLPSNHF